MKTRPTTTSRNQFTEKRLLDLKRLKQIFAVVTNELEINASSKSALQFPELIRRQLMPRDFLLLEFTEIANIRVIDATNVLVKSRDGYCELLANGEIRTKD